jgi:hypothetical protein
MAEGPNFWIIPAEPQGWNTSTVPMDALSQSCGEDIGE